MIEYKIIEAPYYKKISGDGPDEVSLTGAYPGDNYEIKYRPAVERNENGRITLWSVGKALEEKLVDVYDLVTDDEVDWKAVGPNKLTVTEENISLDSIEDAKKEAAEAFAKDSEDSAIVARSYLVRGKEVTIDKKGNVS